MSDEDIIIWNASYVLKWSDFKSKINPDPEHDSTSAVGYSYTWKADFDNRENPKKFHVIEVNLETEFHRNDSFVKPKCVSEGYVSNVLLLHEQGHFDLAEELISKCTKAIMSGCKGRWFQIQGASDDEKMEFIKSTAQTFVDEQVERVRKNIFRYEGDKYDEKTNHGRIPPEQDKFNEQFKQLRKIKLQNH